MRLVSAKVTAAVLFGTAILAVGGPAAAGAPTQVTIPGLPSTTTTLATTTLTTATTTRPPVTAATSTTTSIAGAAAAAPTTTVPAKRGPAKAARLGSPALASFGPAGGPNQNLPAPELAADAGGQVTDQKPVAARTGRAHSSRSGPPLVLCLMGALAALGLGAMEFKMLRPAQAPS